MLMQVLKISSQQQRQQKNALGIVTLGSLIFQGFNLLLLLGLLSAFWGLKDKAPPAMVQMEGGRTIAMEPLDTRERTPAVIQKFVRDQLTALMSASGQMPSGVIPDTDSRQSNPNSELPDGLVPDPGVEIPVDGEVLKVSTLARIASFGISEDFRSAFLQDLARRTPQSVFMSGGAYQRLIIFQDVSDPEPISPGQWKVTVISSLVDFESGNPVGIPRPFNKEIFVQSVPVPVVTDFSSDLEKRVAEIRAPGLEIYAIRNYIRRNISSPSDSSSGARSSSSGAPSDLRNKAEAPSIDDGVTQGLQDLEPFIE